MKRSVIQFIQLLSISVAILTNPVASSVTDNKWTSTSKFDDTDATGNSSNGEQGSETDSTGRSKTYLLRVSAHSPKNMTEILARAGGLERLLDELEPYIVPTKTFHYASPRHRRSLSANGSNEGAMDTEIWKNALRNDVESHQPGRSLKGFGTQNRRPTSRRVNAAIWAWTILERFAKRNRTQHQWKLPCYGLEGFTPM